ncbi:hypothetical protein QBC32DRAFT_369564 [Pseudoneurospora amorphoporcata]|uniref:Uncharacterized protein n=1 Tax=Pseudoneurospora amorphoporcata TaxID=241081 RepID=A0AAN6NWH4_9PEZI|nr:hypothetical protein QBC32DRAFT_369564 [Pseudoneurospora amorphoporcata]
MAPFALPGGSETRNEIKNSLATIWDSLIGGGTDDAWRTDGGNPVHLSQTSYRERTTTYSGKITVIPRDETNGTTTGGKTGCGKFNILCRGNRTSGKGRNNDGDDSDKGGGKENDSGSDDGNSSSRPTNKPESTTIGGIANPGPTSLLLVSGQTQAPTLSLPPDRSLTSMESPSFEVSPFFTTSNVPQATAPDQATWTPKSNQKSSAASVKGDSRQPWWDIPWALNHPSPTSERTETAERSESVGSLCSYEKVNELLHQPHSPGIQIQYQQPNPIHHHCGSPLPYATFANVAYPANITGTRNLAVAAMYSHQAQQFSTSSSRSQDEFLWTTAVSIGAGEIQYVNSHDPKNLLSPCSTFQDRGQRMSDISSLSSGFGDGDFIVPEQTVQPPQPAAIAYPSSPIGTTNRLSGISTQQGGKRDTIYTESSEDTPARFRSLNSWVAQQTSRVKRDQKRDEASYLASVPQLLCQPGVPSIHNPPVEQTFNLTRDNEKPAAG